MRLPANPFSARGGGNAPALPGRLPTAGENEQFVEGHTLHTCLKE